MTLQGFSLPLEKVQCVIEGNNKYDKHCCCNECDTIARHVPAEYSQMFMFLSIREIYRNFTGRYKFEIVGCSCIRVCASIIINTVYVFSNC